MLELPLNFSRDIAGRDTALIPYVLIYSGTEYLRISTNIYSHQQGDITVTTLPILLNIPSLKESIDIEKRNYRISNLSIDLSNYEYNGKRFSERITGSLINTECRIYWVSPSTKTETSFDQGYDVADYPESFFQIYYGTIRRYTHDDEKVRLVIEDRSQATLHKDLPLPENYLTGDDVPDKYKNKPIPLVYGHVDRSPCVIKKSNEVIGEGIYGNVNLLFDREGSSITVESDSLKIFSDNMYLNVPKNLQSIGEVFEYNADLIQWDTFDNYITLISSGNDEDNNINPIADNRLVVLQYINDMILKEFKQLSTYWTDVSDEAGIAHYTSFITQTNEIGDSIAGTFCKDFGSGGSFAWDGTSRLWTMPENTDADIPVDWTADNVPQWGMPAVTCFTNALTAGGNFEDVIGKLIFNIDVYAGNMTTSTTYSTTSANVTLRVGGDLFQDRVDTDSSININSNSSASWNLIQNSEFPFIGSYFVVNVAKLLIYIRPEGDSTQRAIGAIKLHFKQLIMENYLLAKDVISQDYYANVNGRAMQTWETPTQTHYYDPTAPQVIAHILNNELGQDVVATGTYSWLYAFTVDKKINSKKLIEGIASASPYIPRFNNMGNFKFTEIPMDGNPVSPATVQTIKEADCIEWTFSRSKIEDVYTKIQFFYNWDYARGEFNDSVKADIQDILGEDYKFDYYGFTEPYIEDEEEIHPDSTLLIDGEQGKYIRTEPTAQAFADWYLMWSCNQHLKMKIKLPLKMMFLEIGDFVDFDAILGGVKPYGIDYINDGEEINSQEVFKNFLITSTNKTLEFCQIECIQMHNLGLLQYIDTIFNADEYYDVIASPELNGVTLVTLYGQFPELGNLTNFIHSSDGVAQYDEGVWIGDLEELVGGDTYAIKFSQETTTNLFQLIND